MNINTREEFVDISQSASLHMAAKWDYTTTTQLLVEQGHSINGKEMSKGGAPLHFASGYGAINVVKQLISMGANVNIQDNEGMTPLHVALGNRYMVIANFLVEHGANMQLANKQGITPKQIWEHIEKNALLVTLKDPHSGFIFPEVVGKWKLDDPALRDHGGFDGISISYNSVASPATVYIYGSGDHEAGEDFFHIASIQGELENMAQKRPDQFRLLSPFKDIDYESGVAGEITKWSCSCADVIMNNKKQKTWIYLTVYNGYYFKVRHTYVELPNDAPHVAIKDLMDYFGEKIALKQS